MAAISFDLMLHRAYHEGLDEAAFLDALPDGLIGFAYGARQALWVRATGKALVFPPGAGDLGPLFELRLFNAREEWRWVRGRGAARVATAPGAPQGWTALDPLQVHAVESEAYLLWGASQGEAQGGWTLVGDPRTGPFRIPMAEPGKSHHIALERVRYLARGPHGNVRPVEERLVALRAAHIEPTREAR